MSLWALPQKNTSVGSRQRMKAESAFRIEGDMRLVAEKSAQALAKKQRHPKVAWLFSPGFCLTSFRFQSALTRRPDVGTRTSMHFRTVFESNGERIPRPWCAAHQARQGSRRRYDKLHHVLCPFPARRLDSGPDCTTDNHRHCAHPATERWSSSGCCLVCVVNCRKQIFALLKLKLIEQIQCLIDARHGFQI